MSLKSLILRQALDLREMVVNFRREFHMYPELAYQEKRTSNFVSKKLEEWGFEVHTGIAETGVLGVLRCSNDGRVVALRADMDALPIQEENDVPYKSKIPGVMHACGHDAHTAMLLTAAKILANHRDKLLGTVKLIFQPAEEGGNGAKRMIDEGVLKDPDVEAIFGLHVWNSLDAGKVGLKEGPLLASTGRFEIEVEGSGGHGASPHLTIDPIVISASIILNLQTIISRSLDPLESGVVSVCSVHSGTAFNVIPNKASLIGTYRALTFNVRDLIKKRIEEISKNVSSAFNAKCNVKLIDGVPPTVNEPRATRMARKVAEYVVGSNNVIEVKPTMGGEDFSFYLENVPGAFLELGTRNEKKGITAPHHNSRFDIDESALPYGVALYALLAYNFLMEGFKD
ncbi:MAG: amidohydrolase [Candidatus Methanomethylicota archaeon]|nr:MAG: amidohydrolase [Candidatus Verstraetearchaeota archaeon]